VLGESGGEEVFGAGFLDVIKSEVDEVVREMDEAVADDDKVGCGERVVDEVENAEIAVGVVLLVLLDE